MVNKKLITAIVSVVLVLAIIVTIKVMTTPSTETPSEPYYFTEEPETWIEDIPETDDVRINVNKATKTLGFFDGLREEFDYYGKRLTFFYHGYYKGKSFDEIYIDEEFYDQGYVNFPQQDIEDTYVKMKISEEMNPNDGIIEGFILVRLENEELVFHVFLDEDWKNNVEYTNILWTNDFTTNDVNVNKFDFTESHNGIYINKIQGNFDWFKKRTNGGIYVGEIDDEVIKKTEYDGTLMYVR